MICRLANFDVLHRRVRLAASFTDGARKPGRFTFATWLGLPIWSTTVVSDLIIAFRVILDEHGLDHVAGHASPDVEVDGQTLQGLLL